MSVVVSSSRFAKPKCCPSIPDTVLLLFVGLSENTPRGIFILCFKEKYIRVAKLECYVNLNITICISKLTKCGTFLQNSEFI